MSNKAAWITAKLANPLKVDDAPLEKPGNGEVLVKNAAVAINPVDWKIQDYGPFVRSYPNILGCDVAGTIEAVGSDVTKFKKGDRVMAHCISLANQKPAYSGFQNYTISPAVCVAPIPQSLSFAQASVLPLAIDTAAIGLYRDDLLGLPYPTVEATTPPSNRTIFITGGSSSVGTVAIQLARASGLKVITTASSKNHDYVKSLGASAVFDHNDSNVASQVVEEARGSSFAGVYDAISLENTFRLSLDVSKQLGGSQIITTLPASEELQKEGSQSGVTFTDIFAGILPVQYPDICREVWWSFMASALQTGKFQALPQAVVVGKGLKSIQMGVDKQREGVSAKKIVVEL